MKKTTIISSLLFLIIGFFIGIIITVYHIKKIPNLDEAVTTDGHIYNLEERSKLKVEALQNADINAYDNLFSDYFRSGDGGFLEISLIMAYRNHYPKAYYDIYQILDLEIIKIDQNYLVKNNEIGVIAGYYLIKSKELGYSTPESRLKEYFPDSIPTSKEYLLNSIMKLKD